MVRDLTPKFREAVRAAAVANAYDEARLAKVMSSLMLHTTPPRSAFYLTATNIAASIRDLQKFVASHSKDYAEKHRTTEQDRDSIENEIRLFVKACQESIEALKNSIGREEKQTYGANWLQALGRGSTHTNCIAHQHGVVLILTERLHAITKDFDQLRSVRFEETVDKKMYKRRKGLEHLPPPENVPASVPDNDGYSRNWLKEEEPRLLESRQQLMDQESDALQQELTEMMAMTQETERKMIEISALNYLFSTHVLRQAQQIETLYTRAMEATDYMEKGNKELTKTQQRNKSSRLYIYLIFSVLISALFFLDWFNG